MSPEHTLKTNDLNQLDKTLSLTAAYTLFHIIIFSVFKCVSCILTHFLLEKECLHFCFSFLYLACCMTSLPTSCPRVNLFQILLEFSCILNDHYPRLNTATQEPGALTQQTYMFQKMAIERLPCLSG